MTGTDQPAFMHPDAPLEPPVYDRKALKTGDEVVVRVPRPTGGGFLIYQAVLVKKGRIWGEFAEVGNPDRTWRLNLDTRVDSGFRWVTFKTPEEFAYDKVWQSAWDFLTGQGLSPHYGSPWEGPAVITLARAVWPIRRSR